MERTPVTSAAGVLGSKVKWYRVGVAALLVTTAVSTTGWIVTSRRADPADSSPECYRLIGNSTIEFTGAYGAATTRATLVVVPSRTEVLLGYGNEAADGSFPAIALAGVMRFDLGKPLGDRNVVGPSGDAIPVCG
jgi:hypothetical protein